MRFLNPQTANSISSIVTHETPWLFEDAKEKSEEYSPSPFTFNTLLAALLDEMTINILNRSIPYTFTTCGFQLTSTFTASDQQAIPLCDQAHPA